MKFSYNWLKKLVPHNLNHEELSNILTMSGIEVESVEKLNNFSNIVIGHVIEVEKHKNADKLKVTKVDIGSKIVQIVCGASNVKPNIKVPCALIGAILPNGLKIKKVNMRGEESNGMLCSADEIGLGKSDGLLILSDHAPIGEDILNYLDLNDYIITTKITPNRPDCLSMKGIARELSILTHIEQNNIDIVKNKTNIDDILSIKIQDTNSCGKFLTRIIKNVNNTIPTPSWIIQRLQKSDIKSINFLVDITNYIMIELGQPMHVYDLDKINGTLINVRNAKHGEKLLCLNDKEIILNDDTLVISDDKQILSLAGIIGGKHSSVSLETKNILLEAAFFTPDSIIGKPRKYGFSSESSYRFERGVDFNLQEDAIERATSLIIENNKTRIAPINKVNNNIKCKEINLSLEKVKKILGIEIPPEKIYKILKDLSFHPKKNNKGFTIISPSFRFDINLEIDIIEEIARIFGYDNIITKNPYKKISILSINNNKYPISRIHDILINKGYHEVINYSFISNEWEKDFNNNENPIYLKNPIINYLNVMQSSLIGNLINTLKKNLNRNHKRIKIFEIASIFSKDFNQNIIQEKHIGGLAYGSYLPEQWGEETKNIDFFNVKNDIELLLNNKNYIFEKSMHPAFHPGKSSNIILNNENIGFIGEIHPKLMQKYNIDYNILVFEIKLDAVLECQKITYKNISKFQPVIRDISLIMDKKIEYQQLLNILNENKDEAIKQINIFDLYEGNNIPKGMKSLTIKIIFQDNNKTMEINEIDEKVNILIKKSQKIGAILR